MSSVLDRIAARIGHEPDATEPAEGSMGLGRTFMLWLAANMVVTTLLTGTLFVPGIAYATAVLVIVLGTLIGVAVLVLVGTIGTRTGLPTMILSRGAFGRRGGHLPAMFNLIILMGWSWVQALLAGITLNFVIADLTGFSSPVLFAVLCQTIVVVLALLGHAGIQRVEPWLAVVMLIVAALVFFRAFRSFGLSGFLGIPEQPDVGMTAAIALDVVVATAISWTVLSADFNRHAITPRAGIVGTTLGYTASTVIAMTLGATALGYVFLRGGETTSFDPTVLLAQFGLPLAVVIFVSVMATNTMVVYGMTMSYANLRPNSNYVRAALVIGLISIAGATWQGILDRFVSFLLLISALFIPVFAIMIVDYWILRRGRYSARDLVVPRGGAYWYLGGVNLIAVGCFVVGAALVFYWTRVNPLSFGATLPSFAVTFVLYLALSLALGSKASQRGAPGAQDGSASQAATKKPLA
jgi:nucleobase:cation symporter-1, NCS1 family